MNHKKQIHCIHRHHIPNKSRKSKRFCDFCDSYIEEYYIITSRKKCPCCNGMTTKKKKFINARSILNKALSECQHIIDSYNLFPTCNTVGIIIFVKHQHFTYSVPLPVMARYSESFQNINTGNYDNFWSDDMINDSSFSKVLQYCEKRIKFVGLR